MLFLSNIYSDVFLRRLEAMRVASYRIISKNPEEEVIEYMRNWVLKNGLDKQVNMRSFGFDVSVGEEQRKEGLRGYEYWVTVPNDAFESEGVKIKNIEADEYAVLRITDPFSNPFDTIPNGWKRLNEWVMNSEYKTTNFNNRYWLEEVIEEENTTYMDIYFPIKDGGRKPKAEIMNFSIIELTSCKLIGKEIRCKMGHPEGNPIPAFWGKCFADGTMKKLEEHPDRLYSNAAVGWIGNFNPIDKTFSYVVGVFVKAEADMPEGMFSITMPQTRYAVGSIKGNEPDIYMHAHSFTESEMKKAGLNYNSSCEFEMEWYDERFCESEGYKIIDMYIPIE